MEGKECEEGERRRKDRRAEENLGEGLDSGAYRKLGGKRDRGSRVPAPHLLAIKFPTHSTWNR